jgi:hypothetical protein
MRTAVAEFCDAMVLDVLQRLEQRRQLPLELLKIDAKAREGRRFYVRLMRRIRREVRQAYAITGDSMPRTGTSLDGGYLANE